MGLFGEIEKGLLFVVSAPAGTGKTTLVDKLIGNYPNSLAKSVSCTTRSPRGHEKNFQDYIFLTEEEFQSKKAAGAFLESAKVFNYDYGTLKATVYALQNQGKHVFLVIDTQGAMQLKGNTDTIFVFLKPPTIEVLQKRLASRHTESEEAIRLRLSYAEQEMQQAKNYDVIIVNDDLEKAYQEFKTLIEQKEQVFCRYL